MLKKTLATGILALTAAAGALATSAPATAQAPTARGCWGGCSSSHFRFFSGQSSFNANRNALFNHIPIRIRNRNNNVAINNQTQNQFQREGLLGGLGFDDE